MQDIPLKEIVAINGAAILRHPHSTPTPWLPGAGLECWP